MDAYSTANWGLVLSTTANAAAALTGLLFVALSINLGHVIKGEGLVARAVEVFVLLTAMLIVSVLLLMPGQQIGGSAIETLAIGIAMVLVLGYIHVRAPRAALHVSGPMFAMRVAGAQLGTRLHHRRRRDLAGG